MSFSVTLIDLAGFAALLLWGVHMVQSGVMRALGPRLKVVLRRALRSPVRGFGAGIIVTTLLQSSTATALVVSGFAASGLVALVPALAVMLGANIGTTLIVQVLSFDVTAFAPVAILAGLVMFRRGGGTLMRDLGRAAIGLGLIVLALHHLVDLLRPLEDAPSLRMLMGVIATVPLLDVMLAAVLTWAVHSSVAVVLITASLAAQGVVPPNAAIALVLGANLGSAIAPVVQAMGKDDRTALRLPVGNLLNRFAGVAVALALIEPIGALMVTWQPDAARVAVDFHTVFNIVTALVFLPLLAPFARLLEWLYPDREDADDPSRPRYLAPAADTPVVALGAAAREALRLADALDDMLDKAARALLGGERRRIAEARDDDDILDRLNREIRAYLAQLDPDELSPADRRRVEEILAFSANLEQAADVVSGRLMADARKRLKRGIAFSKAEEKELAALFERLKANIRLATSLFMTADPRAARLLALEKAAFRDSESAAARLHFDRLRQGLAPLADASGLGIDIVRDLKLVNSHVVAAAAYPVLARTGELLDSRLAEAPQSC
ncbi:Na/Pi cotransporter family protein [Xanthobacter tagetidis]|uniref:Na/Pi cotransporter family protein n=1 Tax=Xanthobacter tagetidis TaxID=60216 RepID=A0A3L7A5K9_9HYPH|nr:Na/Pi cotransporter family protein [Xanthobacter tagetidis]MBB6310026.1 phosphate:Na+ symporter [Xanthobacter tagetidis]RLP75130.1 Na/Pi cotransporter family protein [Xanthobacter tagetidis]